MAARSGQPWQRTATLNEAYGDSSNTLQTDRRLLVAQWESAPFVRQRTAGFAEKRNNVSRCGAITAANANSTKGHIDYGGRRVDVISNDPIRSGCDAYSQKAA